MKNTLTTYEIAQELLQDENAAWTRAGALALAEHLEQLEDDAGEEMELDIVAIRCDFSEYARLEDWAVDYFSDSKQAADEMGLELDMDGETWIAEEDEVQESIRSYINDHGTLIEFDGGIIVSSF